MVRTSRTGFSLVELTIALGIVAFALTAIIGLLSITLKNSKSAVDDTLLAEMSSDLISHIRKRPFNSISTLTNVYYDMGGKRLNAVNSSGEIQGMPVNTAVAQGAVYECVPSIVSDAETVSADGTVNLRRIALKFQWPAGVANAPGTRTIHSDVARY